MIRQSSHGTLKRDLSSPSLKASSSTPSLKASSSTSSLGLRRREWNASPRSARPGSRKKDKTILHPQDIFDQLPPEQQWWQLEMRRMQEAVSTFRGTWIQLQDAEDAARQKMSNLEIQLEESKAEAEVCMRNVQIAMEAIAKWEVKSKEVRPLFEKTQTGIAEKLKEKSRLQDEVDNLQKQLQMLESQIERDQSRFLMAEAQQKERREKAKAVEDVMVDPSLQKQQDEPLSGEGDRRKELLQELRRRARTGLVAAKRDGRLSAFAEANTAPSPSAPIVNTMEALSQNGGNLRRDDVQEANQEVIKHLCARMKADLIAALRDKRLTTGFSGFNSQNTATVDDSSNKAGVGTKKGETIKNVAIVEGSDNSSKTAAPSRQRKHPASTKAMDPKSKTEEVFAGDVGSDAIAPKAASAKSNIKRSAPQRSATSTVNKSSLDPVTESEMAPSKNNATGGKAASSKVVNGGNTKTVPSKKTSPKAKRTNN